MRPRCREEPSILVFVPPSSSGRAPRRWLLRVALLLAPLALVLARGPVQAQPPLQLTLGISDDLYTSVYEDELKPIRSYVEEAGVRIATVRVPSPERLGELLAKEQIDIGLFTPVTYVRQHDRTPDLKLFASHAINGTLDAQSYIVVRADSGIVDLQGLRGKRFAYTDADSFGGYLFPRYALWKADLSPERHLASTVMTGDFLESLRAVHRGAVDGAAVLDEILRIGQAEGLPQKDFRVLAKSRRVPYMAYVARPHLPGSTIEQLRRLLTSHRFKRLYLHIRSPLQLPGPWARLTPRRSTQWLINGFVTVNDGDFEEVRRMLRFVEHRERAAVEGGR